MAEKTNSDGVTREQVLKSFEELRQKLKLPSPKSLNERKRELRRQAQEIIAKYPQGAK
jgi:hypothetical protein